MLSLTHIILYNLVCVKRQLFLCKFNDIHLIEYPFYFITNFKLIPTQFTFYSISFPFDFVQFNLHFIFTFILNLFYQQQGHIQFISTYLNLSAISNHFYLAHNSSFNLINSTSISVFHELINYHTSILEFNLFYFYPSLDFIQLDSNLIPFFNFNSFIYKCYFICSFTNTI